MIARNRSTACSPGQQRAVFVEVVRRNQAARNRDAGAQTVQRGRLVDVGQVARRHRVEVIVERHVQRRAPC